MSCITRGSICKACFSFKQLLFPIDGILVEEKTVQNVLEALFPDVLNNSNGAWRFTAEPPKYICLPCKAELKKAYTFQQMVIKTDQRIKKLFEAIKVDESNVPESSVVTTTFVKPKVVKLMAIKPEIHRVRIVKPKFAPPKIQSKADLLKTDTPFVEFKVVEHKPAEFSVLRPVTSTVDSNVLGQVIKQEPQINGNESNDLSSHDYNSMAIVKDEPIEEEELLNHIPEIDSVTSDREHMSWDSNLCEALPLETTLEINEYVKIEPDEVMVDNTIPHNPQSHYCHYCLREFSRKEIKEHLPTCKRCAETRQSRFSCDTCKKNFLNMHRLNKHLAKNHNPLESFKCDKCSKDFSKKYNLIKHLASHIKKAYSCDDCGKKYTTAYGLKLHTMDHTDAPKPFQCKECDASFRLKSGLDSHVKRHSESNKVFQCIYCSMRFFENSELKKHIKRHMGTKNHCCQMCPMKFTESSDLHKHIRSHTKERPYLCKICGISFSLSSTLAAHRRMHEGLFTYRCGVCDKGFYRRSEYNVHYRRHSDAEKCGVDDQSTKKRIIINRK